MRITDRTIIGAAAVALALLAGAVFPAPASAAEEFALPPLGLEESIANTIAKELVAAMAKAPKIQEFVGARGTNRVGVCAFVSGRDPDSEQEVFWAKPDLAREVGAQVSLQMNLEHVGRQAEMEALLRQAHLPKPLWDLIQTETLKKPGGMFEDLDAILYVFVRRSEVLESTTRELAALKFADTPALAEAVKRGAEGLGRPVAVAVRLSLWEARSNRQLWGGADAKVYDPSVYLQLRRLIAGGEIEDAEALLVRFEATSPGLKGSLAGVREAIARRAASVALARIDAAIEAGDLDGSAKRIAEARKSARRASLKWALEQRATAVRQAMSNAETSKTRRRLQLLNQLSETLPPEDFLGMLEKSRTSLPTDAETLAAIGVLESRTRARLRRQTEGHAVTLLELGLLAEAEEALKASLKAAAGAEKQRLTTLLALTVRRKGNAVLRSIDGLIQSDQLSAAESQATSALGGDEARRSPWLMAQLQERLRVIRAGQSGDRIAGLRAMQRVLDPKTFLARVSAALEKAEVKEERAALRDLRDEAKAAVDLSILVMARSLAISGLVSDARDYIKAQMAAHPKLTPRLTPILALLKALIVGEVREAERLLAAGRPAEAKAVLGPYRNDPVVGAEVAQLLARIESGDKVTALLRRAGEWLQQKQFQKVIDLAELPSQPKALLDALAPLVDKAKAGLASAAAVDEIQAALDAKDTDRARALLSALDAKPGGTPGDTAELWRRLEAIEQSRTQKVIGVMGFLILLLIMTWFLRRQQAHRQALDIAAEQQGTETRKVEARERREETVARDAELRQGVARSLTRARQTLKDCELGLVRDQAAEAAAAVRSLIQDLERLRSSIEDASAGNAQRLYGASADDPALKELVEFDRTTTMGAKDLEQAAELLKAKGNDDLDASVEEFKATAAKLRTRIQERERFLTSTGG